jgi:acetylornithine/succinyldiaminopimelate/putrescine aminotransferase
MEIFNETTLLVSSYFMFLFTDFVDDIHMRATLGWAYIGVIGTMIVVNFGCMIIKVFQTVKSQLTKLWKKWQKYKAEKVKKEGEILAEYQNKLQKMRHIDADEENTPSIRRSRALSNNINTVRSRVNSNFCKDEV